MDNSKTSTNTPKIGIALSGGSARGFAHIGILKALTEYGIAPDIISGTSMGALVGALYAAGHHPEEIQKILTQEPVFKVLGFSWKREGILKIDKLEKVLQENFPENSFSALKKPFYLGISNMNEGKVEFRHHGELCKYIVASCSAPIIFAPQVIDDITYLDGGLMCNLPASAIRDECDILIGAHVNFPGVKKSLNGVSEIMERTMHLGIYENTKPEMEQCDFILDPPGMQYFSLLDFKKAAEIIDVGYDYTLQQIKSGEFESLLSGFGAGSKEKRTTEEEA